jgi:DNA-binding NtrC family response regulator
MSASTRTTTTASQDFGMGIPLSGSMSAKTGATGGRRGSSARSMTAYRRPLLRILLVHSDVAHVERCLQELRNVQWQVRAEVVLTLKQCAERLSSKRFDVVLAEYPIPHRPLTQALESLHHRDDQIPLIFVTDRMGRETVAELIMKGAADCVEMDHLGYLPVAIRRALNEKSTREERDRAEKKLRHSKARYRALVGNPIYEIGRAHV